MSKQREIEDNFYLLAKMVGIQQTKPTKFLFEGRTYTVHAAASPEVTTSFGGKRRAFRLLRHAQMIEHVCSMPNKGFLFGVVARAFDQVSSQYPVLRSYYEAARVGGYKHTWMR
jgi:hypothetical protein